MTINDDTELAAKALQRLLALAPSTPAQTRGPWHGLAAALASGDSLVVPMALIEAYEAVAKDYAEAVDRVNSGALLLNGERVAIETAILDRLAAAKKEAGL